MVQVNTRLSEVVWTLLEKVVRERRIELVAVQEPPLSALRDEGKWEGFDFLFSRGSPPQVALIINSKIKFSPLQLAGSRVCGVSELSGVFNRFYFILSPSFDGWGT